MAAAMKQRGVASDIPPPTDKSLEVKDKLSLVLEVVWLLILLLPSVFMALFKTFLPGKGKSLKGNVVLVTGGGRGLGRGLVLGFAREGCKVAVVDINMTNATQTAAEITDTGGVAKAYFCNVAKVADVRALREAVTADLGPVDILVNNAGLVYAEGTVEECKEDDIRAVLDVNLLSNFWTVREFVPSMKARNSGHIVTIASICSMYAAAKASAYAASKFGVYGLMEVVRDELETRVNNEVKTTTVFPYFINTSAQYVGHWDLRFPPVSIDEAVEATITGVKRDDVAVIIPWYIQPFIALGRFVPRNILERGIRIMGVSVQPQTKEEISNHPITYIVDDMNQSGKTQS